MIKQKNACAACAFWFTWMCACISPAMAADPQDISASKYNISEFSLKNGARLLVKKDHRGPVVITQFWYKVGSSDEYNGITGVSHALEHMMFKGTAKYPADSLTQTIKSKGGQYNAFTGPDYTAYYEVFEASNLELSFEIESDRMVNLLLREEDFAKEIEVVKEERRLRTEDNPHAKMWERLYALAFRNAPYGNPVIGWMDDLNSLRLSDLEHWYETWYTPKNLVIVVAGDVDPDAVYRLAQKYVEPLASRPVPQRKPRHEAKDRGQLQFTLQAVAKKPYLMMANYVPNTHSDVEPWEPFALLVLSKVLSGTSASRFPTNLIRGKKIALNASAAYDPYSLYDDLFVITGTPLEGFTIADLQAAIDAEIDKLKKEKVDQDLLEIIKTRIFANQVYGQDSLIRQAYLLGQFEITGLGWREFYRRLDRIQQVTPEQVQTVAVKYLNRKNRITGELDPQTANMETPTQ